MLSKLWDFLRNNTASYSTPGIVALFAAGLVFLIWPQAALGLICRLLGVVILVYGIILFRRCRQQKDRSYGTGSFILSILLIIIGLIITVSPFFLVRISGILLALFFLAYGLISFVRRMGDERRDGKWLFGMAGAVFEFIMGILLLVAPVTASSVVLRIVGILFLYAAASAFSYRSRPQPAGGTYNEDIIEGTARDVTDDTTR